MQPTAQDVTDPSTGRVDKDRVGPEQLLEVRFFLSVRMRLLRFILVALAQAAQASIKIGPHERHQLVDATPVSDYPTKVSPLDAGFLFKVGQRRVGSKFSVNRCLSQEMHTTCTISTQTG